jgi:hypothetical protein
MRFGRRCKGTRRAKPWCPTLDKLLFRDGLLFPTGCLFRGVPLIFSLLVAFQLLGVVPVFAEWFLVDGNNKAKIYVDSETIIRNGERVSVSVLDDLRTAQTRWFRTYLSSRAQEEHDCSNERFRLLAVEHFAGNMGAGDVVYQKSGESAWAPIPRGTLAQSVWKYVCGKKK